MDLGLSNRTAFVLGASQGLGRAIAMGLAAEGASVILGARSQEKLDATASAIAEATGRHPETVPIDLSETASVEAALGRLAAYEVDILVLNGGGPPAGRLTDMSPDVWRTHFATMVESPIRIAGALLPGMRARGWGRVITVLSSGVVQPIPNLGLSNSLRLSLSGWTKTIAAEVAADGVTANALIPGRIHTARVDQLDALAAQRNGRTPQAEAEASRATIPAGRYGKPSEFADAACFLASDRAGYITGSSLRVDGGLIRSM